MTIALIALSVGILLLSAVWPWGDASPQWILVATSLLLFALVIGKIGWHVGEHPRRSSMVEPVVVQEFTRQAMDRATLLLSAELLKNPARYTGRIVHEVQPEDDYLRNAATREVTLPTLGEEPSAPQRYYIPLLYLERGTLIDGLATHSSSDLRVPIVPSSVARIVTYELLVFLTRSLYVVLSAHQPHALDELLESLEPALTGDASAERTSTTLDAPRNALAQLAELPAPPRAANPTWLADRAAILGLWQAALTSYVIFAEVRAIPGTTISLSISYLKPTSETDLDPDEDTPQPKHSVFEKKRVERAARRQRLKARLRHLAGIRPHIYRFPLQYENATASYHLRFDGPHDQYVARFGLERVGTGELLPDAAARSHYVVCRTDDSNTMPYVHAYVRPRPHVGNAGQLIARIAMQERPPGVIGLASLVAAIQLITQYFFLINYDEIFGKSSATDLPAFVLAAPAVVSAWMANQIGPSRLRHLSLSAMLAIAANGAFGLIGVLAALLASQGVDPMGFSIFGEKVSHPMWVALLLINSIVSGHIILKWASGALRFRKRLLNGVALDHFTV